MRSALICPASALGLAVSFAVSAASFNYHGNLQDGGKPADGRYDFQLTLYSAQHGGTIVGGPLIVYQVPVHNGAFSTQADFGSVPKPTGSVWLGVQVRQAGNGSFAALDARLRVDIANTATTGSVCPGAWTIAGNAGNPAGSYLGTADNNPLVFEVNGLQAGSLVPTADATYTNAPNVAFGSSGNSVGTAVGATIGGGGTSAALCGSAGNAPCVNSATGRFSTIGGGIYNTANNVDATVGGGESNTASGAISTVGGGGSNTASGRYSTVGGGMGNIATNGSSGNGLSTVGGGDTNAASGDISTVGGGESNIASGFLSTVGGGDYNIASGIQSTVGGGGPLIGEVGGPGNTASAFGSTVSGGDDNMASGVESTVSGGEGNTASGQYSAVSGGYDNTAAADMSFAAGNYATVPSGNTGTFVWSDSTATSSAPFTSTGANQFLINATGGVGIGTNNPNGNQLRVIGTNAAGVVYAENDNLGLNAPALHAYNAKGYGIVGEGANVAIYSHNTGSTGNSVYLSTSSFAGDFYGNVRVTGNLSVSGSVSKGGGAFKIDDPLDPANKFLSHSFVESPDMKNVYDGVATLDAKGTAWVELPVYFEALNEDFRYQLTALDAPAPSLYIAQRISHNRFRIAGGAPNQQVSWQVTGTRHDAWANAHRIVVEQDKPIEDRGRYLAPEAFGLPASLAIGQASPPARDTSPRGEQP